MADDTPPPPRPDVAAPAEPAKASPESAAAPEQPAPPLDAIDAMEKEFASNEAGLAGFEKHVGDVGKIRPLDDLSARDFGRFSDLEYGISWIEVEIKKLDLSNLTPDQREDCDILQAQCRRLHDNCVQARKYGDHSHQEAIRYELRDELTRGAIKIFHRSFEEVIREYRHPTVETDDTTLPNSPVTITTWYKGLHWQERCYVLAMTVLQSAPSMDVIRSAKELEGVLDFPKKKDDDAEAYTFTSQDLPARTHTKRERIAGTLRVFWKAPELILRMLDFVAEEMTGIGPEHAFKDVLLDWAQQDDSECSLRATRSLAFIMWQNERAHLRALADTWASREGDGWLNAATLLAGAYEAERTAAEREALDNGETDLENILPTSLVMEWLEEWSRYQSTKERRRTALYAYAILGQKYPELALNAIEAALQLTPNAKHLAEIGIDTIVVSMITYAVIAWHGQLRLVMAYLAKYAQGFTEDARETPQRRRDADKGISIVFAAFFMITVGAFGRDDASYDLHEPLANAPIIPDAKGRDLVLAGFLSAVEADLRGHLVMLLAAAIQNRQDVNSFAVLRHWATITWDDPPDAEMRAASLARVAQIANQLRLWDKKPTTTPPRPAYRLLEIKLEQWRGPGRGEKTPINRFADAALTRIK